MPQTLFTTQEPTFKDNADGTDKYSMGSYIRPDINGTVTHIRWYFPLSSQPGGQAVKARLFNADTSSPISPEVTFNNPGTPGSWNQVALSTPVSVTANTLLCPTIWTPLRYVASSGAGSPWPLTNGHLTAPISAGRFTGGASGNVEFPSSTFNNGCYFVDIVFVPEGEVEEPEGLTVSVWNGSVELPATMKVWNGSAEVAANVTEIST
jgi:hypothetical protein